MRNHSHASKPPTGVDIKVNALEAPFATDSNSRSRLRFFLLCLGVAVASTLPGLVNYLTVPHLSLNASQAATWTSQAANVRLVTLAFATCIALFGLFDGHTGRRQLYGSTVLAILGFTTWALFLRIIEEEADLTTVATVTSSIVILVAAARIRVRTEDLWILGGIGASIALYSVLLAIWSPELAFFGDAHGNINGSVKGIVGDNQLAGPYGHSNTLGMVMALSVPFVFKVSRKKLRFLLLGLVIFAMAWTASRTAILAACVSMIFMMLLRLSGFRIRAYLATAGISILWGTVVVLPFLTHDASAFTRRGAIWLGSLDAWAESPLIGVGVSWYSYMAGYQNSIGVQASSGHNLTVSVLVTTGLIGLALVAVLVTKLTRVAILAVASEPTDLLPLHYISTFAILSLTEGIWITTAGSELFMFVGFAMAVLLGHYGGPFKRGSREYSRSLQVKVENARLT